MAGKELGFSGGFLVLLALLLLVLPLPWILAAVVAAAVHECGHALAIRLLSDKKAGIHIGTTGAKMDLPVMSQGREVVCALAGPMAGLCLLLFARWMPRVAICALIQTAYNLLPIFPFDGGRALQSSLRLLCRPPVCRKVCVWAAACCKILICAVTVYGVMCWDFGLLPVIGAILFLIRTK